MGLTFSEWDRALRQEKEWFSDRAESVDLILDQIADKVETEKSLEGVLVENGISADAENWFTLPGSGPGS